MRCMPHGFSRSHTVRPAVQTRRLHPRGRALSDDAFFYTECGSIEGAGQLREEDRCRKRVSRHQGSVEYRADERYLGPACFDDDDRRLYAYAGGPAAKLTLS